jgi:hypothetical protein
VFQLKLVTQVELVRYHASFVKSLTLVGSIDVSTLISSHSTTDTVGQAIKGVSVSDTKNVQLIKSYSHTALSLFLVAGTNSLVTVHT